MLIAFQPSENAVRFLREEEERSGRARDEVLNGMICHSHWHLRNHPHPIEVNLREASRKYQGG